MSTLTAPPPITPSWRSLDFVKLAKADTSGFLQGYADRAEARLVPFRPITPEERLGAFKRLSFYPNGLYVPDDEDAKNELLAEVKRIGVIERPDDRLRAYHARQQLCEQQEAEGLVGKWTGQQALARSRARFRIAAFGRRAGKTTEAAMEAIAVAYVRPRSWVWLAAPTIKLADRAFQKVLETIRDLGLDTRSVRDSAQDKVIILENGAKIEAISLDNIWSAAGAAIDFAVIDEAAQIVPEAWTRAILPPLTDRNGQALLISSWEGEGDFFQQKALEAEHDQITHGTNAAWAMFKDASYDVNFYAFPQGEQTPALLQAAKEMDPLDYLEQFGAIPATSRDRVFPEFKERVHVGDGPGFEYNPGLPVILTVDPSGGANPYCILAIQDYSDHIVIFDEIYESHRSTEELAPMLAERPWMVCREVDPGQEATQKWAIENCFPANTVVNLSGVQGISRRWYAGELVEITTALGYKVSGTPNHPIQTDRGWIGLGSLKKGDRVVCDLRLNVDKDSVVFGSGDSFGVHPDVQDMYAPLGEVFRAAREVGKTIRRHDLSVNFHGDGQNGNVDIVAVEGELLDRLQSPAFQHLSNLQFSNPHHGSSLLPALSPQRQLTFAGRTAPANSLRSRDAGFALLGGESEVSSDGSVRRIPDDDAVLLQESGHGYLGPALRTSNAFDGFSGQVTLDEIVGIRRIPFSDHVYNLQTESHTYYANGVLSHNCTDMIVDSAVPEEVRRWIKMGFPAYGVPEKPQVPDRIPLMKNWLRDPVRFKFFYDKRQRDVLISMGMDPDTDVRMLSLEDRRAIIIRVEETLSDNDMSSETQKWLRSCSRLRVNRRSCPNFITEAKTYSYPKKRRLNMNYREVPRDWMNHAMDAWGYFLWDKKRFAFETEITGYDYLNLDTYPDADEAPTEIRAGRNPTLAAPSPAEFSQDRAFLFLAEMRSATERDPYAGQSYLRAG